MLPQKEEFWHSESEKVEIENSPEHLPTYIQKNLLWLWEFYLRAGELESAENRYKGRVG